MGEKEQLFHTEEFQLINIEGKREIENCHQANATVRTVADKISQWTC